MTFHGIEDHTPGAYSMTRRVENQTKTGWTLIDIRANTAWAYSCPQLTTQALREAAAARAVLKSLQVTVDAGTVEIAEEAVPNGRQSKTSAAFPEIERKWHAQHGVYQFWWKADNADVEFEITFDIADP